MKAVLALALLCIFQLASATEESNDLTNPENELSEAGETLLDREARDAKKGKKKGIKKGGTRSGRKGGQRGKKGNKNSGSNQRGRNSGNKIQGRTTDQCFIDLVAKTKKFNKAQSEHRLAKRIAAWSKLMKSKKNSSASTFSDSFDAIDGASGGGKGCDGDAASKEEAMQVHEKLKNCATTAGANCDEGKLATPIDATLLDTCTTTLDTFAKDFKACLIKATAALQCSCVQALTDPADTCLDFKTLNTAVKAQKDSCTKGTSAGSFGDCRKAEREAAKFTGKCKVSCGGPMTTKAPGGRMDMLRRLGHMKLNLN